MWVAKFSLVHDCILGARCAKYGVSVQSVYLNHEIKDKSVFTYSFHQLSGKDAAIKKFYNSFRKEKRVVRCELNDRAMFVLEKSENAPSEFYNPNMFLIKPVLIDLKGWEHWEIASFDRDLINKFLGEIEEFAYEVKIKSIQKKKLKDVYFPKVMPALTDLQKRAIDLAVSEGYYDSPKKTNLRALAKKSGVSLATYQKHLQVAEKKVIPDAISYLK